MGALGGAGALIAAAFAPAVLPAALQHLAQPLGGPPALQRVVYAAAAVHVTESVVVIVLGVRNHVAPRVIGWFVLMALALGYGGWAPLVAQLKAADDRPDK